MASLSHEHQTKIRTLARNKNEDTHDIANRAGN